MRGVGTDPLIHMPTCTGDPEQLVDTPYNGDHPPVGQDEGELTKIYPDTPPYFPWCGGL